MFELVNVFSPKLPKSSSKFGISCPSKKNPGYVAGSWDLQFKGWIDTQIHEAQEHSIDKAIDFHL